MFMVVFFSWWYGKGWSQIATSLGPRLTSVSYSFSVKQLLGTLFAPWRRIITYPGASINEKFQAWIDNLFSRTIGFMVRLFVLIAALISLIIVGLLTIIEIIIWPLLPPSIVGCLIIGALL